jgi:DNA-binding MarR family transcriptional regulator
MTPLVELITAWEAFAANNPENVTVEAFCQKFLDKHHSRPGKKTAFSLARRIGRLAAIQRTCTRLAFKDIPDIEPDWYYFLHSINEEKEIRKTEVISINLLLEPTTGIDILNRMVKAGLLEEEQDPYDKRSRLLRLTPKGDATLKAAEQQVRLVTDLLFSPGLDTIWKMIDDYLARPEYRIGPLLTKHRPKTMQELLVLTQNR